MSSCAETDLVHDGSPGHLERTMGPACVAGRALLVVGSAALLLACQVSAAFWVVSGSTAANLVFGFSETRESDVEVGLTSFRLYRCSDIRPRYDQTGGYLGSYPPPDGAVWWIRSRSMEIPRRNRLRYGELPEGMMANVPARPLEKPGCYVAMVSIENTRGHLQRASGGFRVAHDGRVAELTRDEYERIFSDEEVAASRMRARNDALTER